MKTLRKLLTESAAPYLFWSAGWLIPVFALAGCAHRRAAPPDIPTAQERFLAAYADSLSRDCDSRFELAMRERSNRVIDTSPPTYESEWILRTCQYTLKITLDCNQWPEEAGCWSHEWPSPAGGYWTERELEAVIPLLPACPPEKKCRQCAADAFVVRRVSYGRYELSRCGVERTVEVRCEGPSSPCSTRIVNTSVPESEKPSEDESAP